MNNEFEQAAAAYDAKVDRVAASLIRDRGMAPWDAIEQAQKIIAERRRRVSAGLEPRRSA